MTVLKFCAFYHHFKLEESNFVIVLFSSQTKYKTLSYLLGLKKLHISIWVKQVVKKNHCQFSVLYRNTFYRHFYTFYGTFFDRKTKFKRLQIITMKNVCEEVNDNKHNECIFMSKILIVLLNEVPLNKTFIPFIYISVKEIILV